MTAALSSIKRHADVARIATSRLPLELRSIPVGAGLDAGAVSAEAASRWSAVADQLDYLRVTAAGVTDLLYQVVHPVNVPANPDTREYHTVRTTVTPRMR